ncbi:glycosyltransferase [Rudanella paleaurantiibacter]|uniref:Glycosyltransferase n=1 Tax=Rudanella paleaurantiibacter TaxID=2614655 RepID=A0A7J5TZH3_9BACT|nr:glycosyltransferase [Rudanella paleaurantiibacter]KAB7730850.1 glycosyltransferase [Rudanella paleaurantiibacter]
MIPDFSVVVPTSQKTTHLLRCLDALSRQRLPHGQFEIIVVDDANDRATAEAVRSFTQVFGIEARYLSQPRRRGIAAARNRGWQAARGRIIAFTNEDCEPQPDWLSAAWACFRRGAQVVSGQMRTTPSARSHPYGYAPAFAESGDFTAANCFCLRTAIHRVGGFSEEFGITWYEDSDLQFRLIRKGIPIAKCPEAVVLHPSQPTRSILEEERRRSYDALLYKRHPDLYRQRMPHSRTQTVQYAGVVLSASAVLAGALSGRFDMASLALGVWVLLTADLFWKRLPAGPITWEGVKQAATTAVATPFLSVYWRLYGSVKYRVLYL